MRGFQNRLRFLSLLVLFFALLLVGKLYFLQIVSGENFKAKAEHQYVEGVNYFDRGGIFFMTKDGVKIPGATIKAGFILHINPIILARLTDFELEKIYEQTNAITPLTKEESMAKAHKTNDPYEELARRLPSEVASKIQALKISGLTVATERWRVYPGGSMAAHTLGLIG